METRYEWDAEKAKANQRKHGVSFETAVEVFSDPFLITQEDVADPQEQRIRAMGMTNALVLLLVVFVDRSEPGVEVIRIISARKAEAHEQSAYEDQFG